jgi:protein-S-isoprenylcysteine O-methyltransferase Ste14
MFVFVRAATYATLFVALVLIFLPARVLSSAGILPPAAMGPAQIAGMLLGTAGALFALWCILSFIFIGRGTPAPFDPPRRLVIRGPYRFVRNPMYIGAGFALAGAALYYQSAALLVVYEEPTLRRMFGNDYEEYCARTGRWWPRL